MGKFLSASRPKEQCASEHESKLAYETSAQQEKLSYDILIESNEQEALKGNNDGAVTSNPNFDAENPSDFDAVMDSNDFNSNLVMSRSRPSS